MADPPTICQWQQEPPGCLVVGSTRWHSCKRDFCWAIALQKAEFTGFMLKASTVVLKVMGIYIPAGLLVADLTSCHMGEVLEIGKYYRILKKLKKKNHSELKGRRARKGNTSGRELLLLYQSQQLLTLIFNTQESWGGGCWEWVKFFKGTQFLVIFLGYIFLVNIHFDEKWNFWSSEAHLQLPL